MADPIFRPLSVVLFFSCFRYLFALQLLTKISREEQRGSSEEMIE